MKHLILFDDSCSLCWRSVNRIRSWDRKKQFDYSPIKGNLAKQVLGIKYDKFKNANTLVLIENYTENDSKVGNLARRLRTFFVWSKRSLCKHKARAKTKHLLHSQRSQKPTFESFSVYRAHSPKVWTKGRAVMRILWLIGGWGKWVGWLALVPLGVDRVYSFVAKRRHRF
jgi:predicted DCC family thiol-disulfide oxidoreductase YuxK